MKLGDSFVILCVLVYVSRIAWDNGHPVGVCVIWGVGFVLNLIEQMAERNK